MWRGRVLPALLISLMLGGCTAAKIAATEKGFPKASVKSPSAGKKGVITLFALENFSDTPGAGVRAANLLYGILTAEGYRIVPRLKMPPLSLKKAEEIAKADGAGYFMTGGISEWRYKNGIDAEPAVSVRLTLYDARSGRVVWSATGSDSDWGNATIAVTAQNLMKEMLEP
ncbi:MAG: hypothetical protein GXO33_00350 [Epsilonproteobacteria bacterium]|nr:hypothetical protein [Campylobacterota bacterium]